MKAFLEIVAEDIIRKYGTDLSHIAVVFPNKRASLFLNEALARLAGRPIWSPAYITISDLFRQHSSLTVGDPIKLVCELYRCFTSITGIDETLDHFYGWGQLLISDFDDIDKNMAVAHDVFRNLRDIHELDDLSYLTEEQTALLQRFFSNFSPNHNSELKRRFLQLWSHIEDIYENYRTELRSQQLAYEGMLYREVAETDDIPFKYDTYLFVGFNMMQKVELRLCERLMKLQKAKFYWDFDQYYMAPDNEAGYYIRELLEQFPNELDNTDETIYNQFSKPKHITFVSAPTENVQARYVSQWLQSGNRIGDGRRTAVVMGDEHLLPSVIHCLPDEVEKVNITTGYPLNDTPISSLVMLLSQLRQTQKIPKYLMRRVMRHSYARFLDEEMLTRPIDDNLQYIQWMQFIVKHIAQHTQDEENPMQAEALFRMYTLLNRLSSLIENDHLDVDRITLQRLLLQLIRSTSIPFHGEPAVGLQVMGVLETRNLDFDHILLLSCNEGNLPKGVNDASFIPYAIRKAYDLTTIDNKVAIFAYYFHRLLQRASDITICYNNSTEDGHTGEMSRFMLQLLVESPHTIERRSLQSGQQQMHLRPQKREKDAQVMETLRSFKSLSPSAINRYLACQLTFYFRYVLGIMEPDDNEEDEIDSRIFGNIFHRSAQLLYDRMGEVIRPDQLKELLQHHEQIVITVDKAIREELFNIKDDRPFQMELNGLQLINREVIIRYLQRLFEIDLSLAPFTIKGNEEKVYQQIPITTSDGSRTISVGGSIDRLDQITNPITGEQYIRVVDYKTGSRDLRRKVNELAEIFSPDNIREKHTDYYLQTMLYSIIVRQHPKLNPTQLPVSPALLFIQHTMAEDYDPTLSIGKEKINDIQTYVTDFLENLQKLVSEIFEPQQPFLPTTDKKNCAHCPYRQLCGL